MLPSQVTPRDDRDHHEADKQRGSPPALHGGFIGNDQWRGHGFDRTGYRARALDERQTLAISRAKQPKSKTAPPRIESSLIKSTNHPVVATTARTSSVSRFSPANMPINSAASSVIVVMMRTPP